MVTGFVLALQFFTVLPIRKAFDMNARSATVMYGAIPLIGVGIGAMQAIFLMLNDTYFELTPLFTAVLMVVLHIVATGGLHMDGVIDTGDAYFSYRDRKKRLEILDDPRIGAFGALTLTLFVILKIGVLYELLVRGLPLLFVIMLPFIARQAGLLAFITMKPSKETGIASYFKRMVNERTLVWVVILYGVIIVAAAILLQNWMLIALTGALLVFTMFYRAWAKRNFGGISGDLLGAIFEWAEVFLWFVLLCIL
ncbi:MAG: adenosylcobinamide-GDP ribazoletransferase [Lysinibacillus sp.]